ncbi:DNA polymerase III subunit gamma/tau [Shewanella atlantica]|uniref:DNA polymerase III subunit gamma/tau n=1 Tax=Shewanella atlantica TaxID=271099 RepID=UPI0037356653
MSYQVLARKWRPATFEQMVGQSHVLHALTNALSQQRLHHAYLFSGTRGVGKTSLARLFAKGLNCERGVTASPCGQCSSCVEISEGRFVDLIEVDAASRTKVDDTRELLDNVQYRPSRGRYKVYLIDEVHMLSRSSFNALLKTLEEPPEHVKFLLATTDPQRLPVTVLSRCLQFNLKSLTLDEIEQQLTHVLSQEQLSFEPQALKLLAKSANGSMRDALSLTDQAIAFGAGEVKLSLVQTMLGSIDEQHVIVLLNALIRGEIENLMQETAKVLSFGADPLELLRSLLELLHQITLSQFAPAAAQLSIYSEQITAFAQQLSPEQVQLYYQLLLTGRKDLPHAPDPKSGLEMALLRAVAFVPEVPVKRWAVDKPADISIPEVKPASEHMSDNSGVHASPESRPAESAPEQAVKVPLPDDSAHIQNTAAEFATPAVKSESELHDETAAVVDKQDDDSLGDPDLLNSLNSEQALILSQAASQGMEQDLAVAPGGELTAKKGSAASEPESESDRDTKVSPELNVSEVQADNSHVADNPSGNISGRDILKTVPEPVMPNSYETQKDQMPDEYYAAQAAQLDAQVDGYDDYPQSMDDYLPFDSLAQGAPDTNGSVPGTQQVHSQSGVDSPSISDGGEDDILDAVLAARDSLLTELVESEPKESGGKKPEAERQSFVPPSRKPATVVDAEQPQRGEPDGNVGETGSAAQPPQGDNREVTDSQLEDRPPWEEQPHPASLKDDSEAETKRSIQVDDGVSNGREPLEADVAHQHPAQGDATKLVTEPSGALADRTVLKSAQGVVLGSGEVTGHDIDLKWYRLMSALDVGGRVRQLAVNSVCHDFVVPMPLLLKPNQKHLAADVAIVQLEQALSRALGEEMTVTIEVGLDDVRETPLEIRQRFHRELLSQAHQGMMSDSNIQWLMEQMDAEFENDSLSYNPELLSSKGNIIELIDKSNFKTLTES